MSGLLSSAFLGNAQVASVPPDLRARFAPAELCLQEWCDYWLELPGIDLLLINDLPAPPIGSRLFRVRFENQLGLARLDAFANGKQIDAIVVEVLSHKYAKPADHWEFFTTLLDDLFARAARLPFTLAAPTSRNVIEALRPPTPLFLLHFLIQEAQRFRQALGILQAYPHRLLAEYEELVQVGQAGQVDCNVVVDILHHPQRWQRAPGVALAAVLGGYAPSHVQQILAEESLDTPENRFVLHFLEQVLSASGGLQRQPWWHNVVVTRQRLVRETLELIQQAITHPLFAEVSRMQYLPLQSRVLQRKEGYRDLFDLWLRFQQARRPLFAPLQRAIELRNIAELYEMWVFFALVEAIGDILGEAPVIELGLRDEDGVEWGSQARFGRRGCLIYNQSFARNKVIFRSYSIGLRPDFIWVEADQPKLVFDAKFRMNIESAPELEEGEFLVHKTPVLDDLYKMHTYRDALGVQAAVALYPGNQSVFYDQWQGKISGSSLAELLSGAYQGIGALPMQPLTRR